SAIRACQFPSSPLRAQVGTPLRRPSKTPWDEPSGNINDAWLTNLVPTCACPLWGTRANRPNILHGSDFFSKHHPMSDFKGWLYSIQRFLLLRPGRTTGPLTSHKR